MSALPRSHPDESDTGAPTRRTLPDFTLRFARQDETRALERLAILDSATVPSGCLLVAEVGGELWAAISLSGAVVIADPFRPTAELVDLLRMRAEQLGRQPENLRSGRSGLARLAAPWRWRARPAGSPPVP